MENRQIFQQETNAKTESLTFDSVKDQLDYLQTKIQEGSFEDRAFGTILGAFIGDSCGSFLEFSKDIANEQVMERCMKMPGGGYFGVAPGQITDDSELAMSLMQALVESRQDLDPVQTKSIIDPDQIAKWYAKWILSDQFDVGTTVLNGLRPLGHTSPESGAIPRAQMSYEEAAKLNQASQSNGSLMRCTPMAVWTSQLKDDKQIQEAIISEIAFTHPNRNTQQTNIIYQSAIHVLLNNPQDNERAQKAFQRAQELANSKQFTDQVSDRECPSYWLSIAMYLNQEAGKRPSDSSFLNSKFSTIKHEGKYNLGYQRHAFILSFYFLLRFGSIDQSDQKKVKAFYRKALKETIQLGGDTDTNACIVGGMIGALVGIKNIDQNMLTTLLSFDCMNESNKWPRSEFLSVQRHAVKNIQKLIELRPTDINCE